MGEINCKECVDKDSNFMSELCLGNNTLKSMDSIRYLENTYNKSKYKTKEQTKSDDKESAFSKNSGEKNMLGTEDKEVLTRISHNFEKINLTKEEYEKQKINNNDNSNLHSSQENNDNNLQEGRYIDPYGQNYQDYDLSNLEGQQDMVQYDQNSCAYMSYKDYSIRVSESNRSSTRKKK